MKSNEKLHLSFVTGIQSGNKTSFSRWQGRVKVPIKLLVIFYRQASALTLLLLVVGITSTYAASLNIDNLTGASTTLASSPSNPALSYSGSGFDATRVDDSTVVKVDDLYYMYYSGLPFWNNYQTGLATSTDGINWERYSANPVISWQQQDWGSFRVMPRSVIYENGQFRMWLYGDQQNLYATGQAGTATSSDGVNWTLDSENPVIEADSNGGINLREVVKLGDTYYAYYSYQGRTSTYYATSQDGINFTKMGVLDENRQLIGATTYSYDNNNFIFGAWGMGSDQYYGISLNGSDFEFSPTALTFNNDPFGIASIIIEDGLVKTWGTRSVGNINWNYGNTVIDYATALEPDWGTIFVDDPSDVPVPEPGTLLLFGTGIVGLLGARHNRNKVDLKKIS